MRRSAYEPLETPVGAGFAESLARPGGNATGLMQSEYSLSGKWLELLKQIAPDVKRAAVLRDPSTTSGIGQFAVIQSGAPSFGVDVISISVRKSFRLPRSSRRPVVSYIRFASKNGRIRQTAHVRFVPETDALNS
ncbi:ABC transporter substrate binding protein [Bradyrhizobium sp.]